MSTEGVSGDALERRLPPVTELAIGSLVCIVVGGIYMASHLPRHASLGVSGALLGAGALLLALALLSLLRIEGLEWKSFFLVGRWALLAYVVIAGMLEYVFVFDHTKGAQLGLLTGMLVVFALDVPLLLAFTVARYQQPTR